jgi:hypothetical protein
VADFFFDEQTWNVRYLVVDTGTLVAHRHVLISPVAVSRAEWDRKLLPLNLTREQVRNSPLVDTQQPVSREHETALMQYYNWPAYWGPAGFPDLGLAMAVPPLPVPLPHEQLEHSPSGVVVQRDRHLHSVRAVRGQTIEATDGAIGHVDDFLLDDLSWEIRYLVVDTRNWWPGKKVIVAPQWIHEVSWDHSCVYVDLTRSAIKSSPAYDPNQPVTPDYAGQLHDHYERPRHGDADRR